MMIWTALNIFLRLILTACMVIGLIRFAERLNWLERAGMGLVGGASIMTVPMIVDVYKRGTPFDGWATSILTTGCIIIVVGIMKRLRGHELRNAEMRRLSEQHLRERGKL